MERLMDGGASLIVSTQSANPFADDIVDFRQMLINCKGLYECPVNELGQPLGPLVGYAGTYKVADADFVATNIPGRAGPLINPPAVQHYVGLAYYNYSMADQWPAVNRAFARKLAENIRNVMDVPDVILGAPMAGIKLSSALAEELGCRHIFAEKKVTVIGQGGQRDEEALVLARYDIHPGDRVLIGEELVNNISSADKLIELIEKAGGEYVGISCAINRSAQGLSQYQGKLIVSVLSVPTPQYRQDDPLVTNALKRGLEIIWKPKPAWDQLKAAMDAARPSIDVRGNGETFFTLGGQKIEL